MDYLSGFLQTLSSNASLKIALSALGVVLVYLVGQHNLNALGVVASLCLIDTITAIYLINKRGGVLKSKKLPKKIYDLTVYTVIIMTMNLLNTVNSKLGFLTDIAILYCAATEALSILEHLSSMGYKIPVSLLKEINKHKE